MLRSGPARFTLAAALALAIYAGCAVSEPLDIDDLAKQRASGAAGSGAAGTSASGTGGIAVSGIAGSTTAGTFGSAGTTGAAGTGGSGGKDVSGQAGTGGVGGSTGGTWIAGTGGGAGFAGRGGTTGSAGRGGTTGFAGSGGAGGSAGRGGTTGTAGRGGSGGSTGGSGSVDAGSNPDGAAAATFTDIYMTILVPYCSGSNCHSPGSQGGVSFASQSTAYSAVSRRVTAGNGAGSSFYNTVNSGSMPRGAAKLSAANLAKIKAWIDAGALNN
jgi:hypothetical protein